MANYDLHLKAANLVRDAGGRLVGRTRLQKVTYLAQLAGFGADFPFEYRHYGPYSEALASAIEIARGVGLVAEEEKPTGWGGWYSVFTLAGGSEAPAVQAPERAHFVSAAARLDAVELELAATAAFLFVVEGVGKDRVEKVWEETARLKPDKAADGRIARAKIAYQGLLEIQTPHPLPKIV